MDAYSNRELDHFFGEIQSKLEEIHDQTKRTNGRVGTLEKWRDRFIAGLITVGAMGTIDIQTFISLLT